MLRDLFVRLLRQEGYSVLSARDGQAGLQISRSYEGKIDLLFTDEEMPRLRGSELYAHLRLERPGIKAVFLTGDPGKIKEKGLPILHKPCDWPTVRKAIRTLLVAST